MAKYAPHQTVSVGLLFVSVHSKHQNSLFRYRSETTETNNLFRIVPKLVSVPVSVVSNRKLVSKDTLSRGKFFCRLNLPGLKLSFQELRYTSGVLLFPVSSSTVFRNIDWSADYSLFFIRWPALEKSSGQFHMFNSCTSIQPYSRWAFRPLYSIFKYWPLGGGGLEWHCHFTTLLLLPPTGSLVC